MLKIHTHTQHETLTSFNTYTKYFLRGYKFIQALCREKMSLYCLPLFYIYKLRNFYSQKRIFCIKKNSFVRFIVLYGSPAIFFMIICIIDGYMHINENKNYYKRKENKNIFKMFRQRIISNCSQGDKFVSCYVNMISWIFFRYLIQTFSYTSRKCDYLSREFYIKITHTPLPPFRCIQRA